MVDLCPTAQHWTRAWGARASGSQEGATPSQARRPGSLEAPKLANVPLSTPLTRSLGQRAIPPRHSPHATSSRPRCPPTQPRDTHLTLQPTSTLRATQQVGVVVWGRRRHNRGVCHATTPRVEPPAAGRGRMRAGGQPGCQRCGKGPQVGALHAAVAGFYGTCGGNSTVATCELRHVRRRGGQEPIMQHPWCGWEAVASLCEALRW